MAFDFDSKSKMNLQQKFNTVQIYYERISSGKFT